MPPMDLTSLAIDGLLIVLLGAVLTACLMVNARLREVRSGQSELADLVQRLDRVTGKAREAVAALKAEGEAVQETLRGEAAKARALADELTLITEAGDNLANRLERRLTGSAKEVQAQGAEPLPSPHGRPEVLKALKEAR